MARDRSRTVSGCRLPGLLRQRENGSRASPLLQSLRCPRPGGRLGLAM